METFFFINLLSSQTQTQLKLFGSYIFFYNDHLKFFLSV